MEYVALGPIRNCVLRQESIKHCFPWGSAFCEQLKLCTALLVQYLNGVNADPSTRLLLPQLLTETGRSMFPGQLPHVSHSI
jgi:hypothetical protein